MGGMTTSDDGGLVQIDASELAALREKAAALDALEALAAGHDTVFCEAYRGGIAVFTGNAAGVVSTRNLGHGDTLAAALAAARKGAT